VRFRHELALSSAERASVSLTAFISVALPLRYLGPSNYAPLAFAIALGLLSQSVWRGIIAEPLRRSVMGEPLEAGLKADRLPTPTVGKHRRSTILLTLTTSWVALALGNSALLVATLCLLQANRVEARTRSQLEARYLPAILQSSLATTVVVLLTLVAKPTTYLTFIAILALAETIAGWPSNPRRNGPTAGFRSSVSVSVVHLIDITNQFAMSSGWVLYFTIFDTLTSGARQITLTLWAPFALILSGAYQPLLRRLASGTRSIGRISLALGVLAVLYGLAVEAVFPTLNRTLWAGNASAVGDLLAPQMMYACGIAVIFPAFAREFLGPSFPSFVALCSVCVGLSVLVALGFQVAVGRTPSEIIALAPWLIAVLIATRHLSLRDSYPADAADSDRARDHRDAL